jgi:hypothetical protein
VTQDPILDQQHKAARRSLIVSDHRRRSAGFLLADWVLKKANELGIKTFYKRRMMGCHQTRSGA